MSETHRNYGKLIAKAWSDAAFRDRLVADPKKVLNEQGWDLADNVDVKVQADSDRHSMVIGLPKKPAGLKDDQLNQAADASSNPCTF